MQLRALYALLLMVAATHPSAAAPQGMTGEDAVYIDWGVKNCAMTSTDREHGLVEEAKAKGADGFDKQYAQHFKDKPLAEAAATTAAREAMCATIKERYGPQGNRLAGLVKWEGVSQSSSSDQPKASGDSKPKNKGRRH